MRRAGRTGSGLMIKEGERDLQNDKVLTLKRDSRPQAAFKALRLLRGESGASQ